MINLNRVIDQLNDTGSLCSNSKFSNSECIQNTCQAIKFFADKTIAFDIESFNAIDSFPPNLKLALPYKHCWIEFTDLEDERIGIFCINAGDDRLQFYVWGLSDSIPILSMVGKIAGQTPNETFISHEPPKPEYSIFAQRVTKFLMQFSAALDSRNINLIENPKHKKQNYSVYEVCLNAN